MHVFRLFVALALAGAAGAAIAQTSRLVSQQSDGLKQYCIYEVQGARLTTRQVLEVGYTDPCPQFYEPPRVARPRVPFMAQLARVTTSNGRRNCIYRLGTREYTHPVPMSSTCPISPRF